MSPVDAQSVGHLDDRVAIGAIVNLSQCTQQHVLNVALNVKYLLSLEKTAQFIVVPVMRK